MHYTTRIYQLVTVTLGAVGGSKKKDFFKTPEKGFKSTYSGVRGLFQKYFSSGWRFVFC